MSRIRPKHKYLNGFTLVEILIVVAVIALLAGVISYTNIKSSLQKARDSKRKQDLHKVAKILDDYYTDKSLYPDYNSGNGTIVQAPWGQAWDPYIAQMPSDPLSPNRDYYYLTDPIKKDYFAIFAKLEYTEDADIITVGCTYGCGPDMAYNYVVHSPNVVMYAGLPTTQAPGSGWGGEIAMGERGGGSMTATPFGNPTATPIPSLTPTASPTPTMPPCIGCTNPCEFGKCGACEKCGGTATGVDCGYLSRCWYSEVDSWACKADISCIWNP